ncbi:hypothetical protein IU451_28945 [Nocardia cyriacigeorgica]|uniref:hypothetical protein n=1 Tax=Nocardia cyriacigeorgica TaxID=135487 RepID=UPI0018930444|nr:hypothetical protein [Nocardia cyriacigeorgica]MBF6326531.1 hypothetical protein [Nocardia cyriacigeorgica]
MPHNIPLMRRVLDHITAHPDQHDQSNYTRCVAGWAIKLDGYWAFLNPGAGFAAIEVVDFHTGNIEYTDDVARDLLGLDEAEAEFLILNADNQQARAWLEDALASHDGKVLAWLEASLVDDDYPFGQVTA